MSEYFILGQDKQQSGGPIIENYPDDIDILDLISGKKLERTMEPTIIELAESSGDFRPDMVTYLLPLFSDNFKNILTNLGVDNIDYYPVIFTNHAGEKENTEYWLANILGLIECLDIENSETSTHPLSKKIKIEKNFSLDDSLLSGQKIFRIAEERSFIIISEDVKNQLEKQQLSGVRIINTREYEGF